MSQFRFITFLDYVDFYSNAQICFKFKLEKQKSYERFKTGSGEGRLERENQELRIFWMKNLISSARNVRFR